jgi:intein/homing endonuclease
MKKNTHAVRTYEEVLGWLNELVTTNITSTELNEKYRTDCHYQFKKFNIDKSKIPQKFKRTNKIKLDYKFENITNDTEAYILGLIFADGCISGNQTKITLHYNDYYILEQIRDYIAPTQKIRQSNKKSSCYDFIISSVEIINNLKRLGVTQNKTYSGSVISSLIPKELNYAFIRGYFDGDGSVIDCYKKYIKCDIASITISILEQIQNELTLSNIESKINIAIREGKIIKVPQGYSTNCKNMYRLFIRKKLEIIKLYKYLYTNSTLHFERKKTKMIKYENTEIIL